MRTERELKEVEIELRLRFIDKLVSIQSIGVNADKEIENQIIKISAHLDCINLHSDRSKGE